MNSIIEYELLLGEAQNKIGDLEKELELRTQWAKDHQRSAEIAFEKRNKVEVQNKKLMAGLKRIDDASDNMALFNSMINDILEELGAAR